MGEKTEEVMRFSGVSAGSQVRSQGSERELSGTEAGVSGRDNGHGEATRVKKVFFLQHPFVGHLISIARGFALGSRNEAEGGSRVSAATSGLSRRSPRHDGRVSPADGDQGGGGMSPGISLKSRLGSNLKSARRTGIIAKSEGERGGVGVEGGQGGGGAPSLSQLAGMGAFLGPWVLCKRDTVWGSSPESLGAVGDASRSKHKAEGPLFSSSADDGEVEQKAFANALMSGRHATVLVFYSAKCRICRSLSAPVAEVRKENDKWLSVVSANVDNKSWLPEVHHYAIRYVPCFVLLDSRGFAIAKTGIPYSRDYVLRGLYNLLSLSVRMWNTPRGDSSSSATSSPSSSSSS
ncbi:hypothetical protein CBR_g61518 [Chara braunii]|uniref:Thioredoxin domain-containing protein n=1 Tax=Chara braunii TaxID=69332 RepID=A0A388K8U9_CHABU|nr:hypothetical protein CBR_g61518 [Chara braunii]|eukprot:GBG66475.1 hypothetical protein CBR_g61518 [Chara braunii]